MNNANFNAVSFDDFMNLMKVNKIDVEYGFNNNNWIFILYFSDVHSRPIADNLSVYPLASLAIAAQNIARMEMNAYQAICSVEMIAVNPYCFMITGSYLVALSFAMRILTVYY